MVFQGVIVVVIWIVWKFFVCYQNTVTIMSKTIIVSNRLPVRCTLEEGQLTIQPSEGGLATGLSAIHQDENNLWIGWPGLSVTEKGMQEHIRNQLEPAGLSPVFLSGAEIKGFYEGFSNEILWPIFHYISTYSNFETEYWKYYVQVNELFKEQVLAHAKPGDTIWIHDYQLLLLPQLLREELPDITIGFFQHIPFPSQELFRLIPWRNELLTGMLGADLLGFQTYDDVRHFMSAASRILGVSHRTGRLEFEGRTVAVDSFPISVDYDHFEEMAKDPEVEKSREEIRSSFPGQKILLSIDRLDYSKGILPRLRAFETLLSRSDDFIKKVVLYMVVVPSRDQVPQYEALKKQVDQEVGRINALYGTFDWQPIVYFYQSFPIKQLSAMYGVADVCLVTSMRDGMNLVCKEYIASRVDDTGVLVLSELAGASHELVDALIINPADTLQVANAIETAIKMPLPEMQERISALKEVVQRFDVHYWANSFVAKLNEIKIEQENRKTRRVKNRVEEQIRKRYRQSKKRLLILDYDGTLVGFHPIPEKACPDKNLYELLESLIKDSRNELVIISGRKREQLDKWFGKMNATLVAEHGVWRKDPGKEWDVRPGLSEHWQDQIFELMLAFAQRTPGARVERKDFSIAWHYRKVQKDLGMIRSDELLESLKDYAGTFGLQILEGSKVIEIRNAGVNKGQSVSELLEDKHYDFVLSVGDDKTDEDMFMVLPEPAITIKVGTGDSHARYFVPSIRELRKLLASLAMRQNGHSSARIKK